MTGAIRVLDIVTGRKMTAEDGAWLRAFWVERAGENPERMIAWLEEIVTADVLVKKGIDPLALVQLRSKIINESYCAPKRSSEAWTHRVRAFLAPPEMVLAADCLTWAVVTPFDLAALARSNAMVGDILGHPVDAQTTEEQLRQIVSSGFDDLHVDIQQRLLWGELRASALEVVWSSGSEETRQQFTEAAKVSFDSHGDVGTTAFEMEKMTLNRLGELMAIARAGTYWLNSDKLSTNFEFIEFVVGTRLSPGDRAEIAEMIVTNFHEDPAKTTETAQNLRHWLDKEYHFGKDPDTGRIRSWTAEEKVSKRAKEAAHLFCNNDKVDDPDGLRFNKIVFADNPVTSADCDNRRITRESDRVLAENSKLTLTRARLDVYRRAFEVVYAVQFSPDERRWFDDVSIADAQNGSPVFTRDVNGFQEIVSDIQKYASTGPHVNEWTREGYAIRLYCHNKDTDHPDEVRLLKIIDDHDPIIFEDCDRKLIVRQSDVDGLMSTENFVAALGGFEPLTEDEIAAWPAKIEPFFNSRTNGQFGYISTFRKLVHWWSSMPFDVRHRTAAAMREEVTSRDGVDAYVPTASERATNQLQWRALCNFQLQQLGYQTQLAGIRSRSIFNTNPNADSPWVNPEAIFDQINAYNIMAPMVKDTCDKVWK